MMFVLKELLPGKLVCSAVCKKIYIKGERKNEKESKKINGIFGDGYYACRFASGNKRIS